MNQMTREHVTSEIIRNLLCVLTMIQICDHNLLTTRVFLHLTNVGVHVAIARTNHALGLALTVLGTRVLLLEVSTWTHVRQLDSGSTRGLLKLAHVSIRASVIAADVSHLARTFHTRTSLYFVLAISQWHL